MPERLRRGLAPKGAHNSLTHVDDPCDHYAVYTSGGGQFFVPVRPPGDFSKSLQFAIMYGFYPDIGDPCDPWEV